MTVHEELLRFLEFPEDEIPELLPDWISACKLLGLTKKDIKKALEEYLPEYWEVSLSGVRKCIGVYIREIIGFSKLPKYKERGDKIIYCNVPAHVALLYANKKASDSVHVITPDNFISTVMNAFFRKKPSLSVKSSSCKNPFCDHCGVNRIKMDAKYSSALIDPTIVWNWGLYCNESSKTEEFIQLTNDNKWNYVLTTIPKDYSSDIRDIDNSSRVDYLALQMKESQSIVSEYTGVKVTEEHVISAVEEYLDYMKKVDHLTDLVARSDPQPLSGNALILFKTHQHVVFDSGFRYLNDAIDTLIDEIQDKVNKGIGILPKGSPKLACQILPFSVPWVCKAFERCGVNLSVDTFFAPPNLQLQYFDKSDIFKSMAQQWFCNPSAVSMRDAIIIASDILRSYPIDGVLYGFFSLDKWIGGLDKTMIRLIEEDTRIPHYYMEAEFLSDENFSYDSRIDRIKSISSKVKLSHTLHGFNYGTK